MIPITGRYTLTEDDVLTAAKHFTERSPTMRNLFAIVRFGVPLVFVAACINKYWGRPITAAVAATKSGGFFFLLATFGIPLFTIPKRAFDRPEDLEAVLQKARTAVG